MLLSMLLSPAVLACHLPADEGPAWQAQLAELGLRLTFFGQSLRPACADGANVPRQDEKASDDPTGLPRTIFGQVERELVIGTRSNGSETLQDVVAIWRGRSQSALGTFTRDANGRTSSPRLLLVSDHPLVGLQYTSTRTGIAKLAVEQQPATAAPRHLVFDWYLADDFPEVIRPSPVAPVAPR